MHIKFVLFLGVLLAAGAQAQLQDIEHDTYGRVALYAAGEVSQIDLRYNYPGMGAVIADSQVSNNFQAPDCLLLVGDFGGPTPKEKVAELAQSIEVFDGREILFPHSDGDADLNLLTPKIIKGTHIYFLKDLSKYVTGLRVKTRNGETIPRLIKRIFGSDSHHNLELLLSRGCSLLTESLK